MSIDYADERFNMVLTFTIDAEIDSKIFWIAFQACVNRDDALRTVIEVIDGVPRQLVVPRLPYSMEFIDLSATPDAERVYRNWIEQRKVRRLDLSVCSLDSVLIKMTPGRFKWYFNQHNFLNDAWSTASSIGRWPIFTRSPASGACTKPHGLDPYQAYVEYKRQFRQKDSYRQTQTYCRLNNDRPFNRLIKR